ncbi:MAG: hypothetical protein KKG59_05635 [Nanoarchaeota archaeon]|nr:hypothetical protein [Nanoarchaeota archaeon]
MADAEYALPTVDDADRAGMTFYEMYDKYVDNLRQATQIEADNRELVRAGISLSEQRAVMLGDEISGEQTGYRTLERDIAEVSNLAPSVANVGAIGRATEDGFNKARTPAELGYKGPEYLDGSATSATYAADTPIGAVNSEDLDARVEGAGTAQPMHTPGSTGYQPAIPEVQVIDGLADVEARMPDGRGLIKYADDHSALVADMQAAGNQELGVYEESIGSKLVVREAHRLFNMVCQYIMGEIDKLPRGPSNPSTNPNGSSESFFRLSSAASSPRNEVRSSPAAGTGLPSNGVTGVSGARPMDPTTNNEQQHAASSRSWGVLHALTGGKYGRRRGE